MAARDLHSQIGAIVYVGAHGEPQGVLPGTNLIYQVQTGKCLNFTNEARVIRVKDSINHVIDGYLLDRRVIDTTILGEIGEILVEDKLALYREKRGKPYLDERQSYSVYDSSDVHENIFKKDKDNQTITLLWKREDVYCGIHHENWFDSHESFRISTDETSKFFRLSDIHKQFHMPEGLKLLVVSVSCDKPDTRYSKEQVAHKVHLGEKYDIKELRRLLTIEWERLHPKYNVDLEEKNDAVDHVLKQLIQRGNIADIIQEYRIKLKLAEHEGGKRKRTKKLKSKRRTRKQVR